MQRKALIFSISLNVLLLFFWIGKRIYYTRPTDQTAFPNNYNAARNQLYDILKIDSGDIVFVGNSITEGFPVTELFGSKFKNRGIGSNLISHVENRMPSILQAKPKAVFLLIGVNDIKSGIEISKMVQSYKSIVNLFKESETILYVSPALPVCGDYKNLMDSITIFNNMVVNLCRENSVPVFDFSKGLIKDGYLNSEYTYDGLHLNGEGYKIWMREMKPLL